MARFVSIWIIILTTITAAHAGEQSISGIVNTYTRVMSVDAKHCRQFVNVASAADLSPGDLVLIIQMKGAAISTDRTEDFGTITDMNACGQYEFARIASVSGTVLELRHTFFNSYDVNEGVQLVRVPQYDDVVVTTPLRAPRWDGSTGGIIALDVSGTLRLASDIDVTGAGFGSGIMWTTGGECSRNDIVLPFYSPFGAAKGEGVAVAPSGMEAGRGRLANGGGGGVSHNSGGGGGGNGGSGGRGGNQYLGCVTDDLISGGLGGQAIDHLSGVRMIFGGAGGNGHQNDGNGAAGAAGGGIIVIRAGRIDGAGRAIIANGTNALRCTNDGGGGGGAGGSIHLQVQEWLSPIRISAAGGNGSDIAHQSAHGPGGGGGGGLVVLSTERPAGMTVDMRGGSNGHNIWLRNTTPEYDYYALSGTEGAIIVGEEISEHTLGNTFTSGLPKDTTVCAGAVVVFAGQPRNGRRPYSISWKRAGSSDVISDKPALEVTARETERFVYTAVDANGCDIVDTVTMFVRYPFIVPDTVNVGTIIACSDVLEDTTFDIVSSGTAHERGTVLSVETAGPVATTLAAGDTFDARHTVRITVRIQDEGPFHGTVRVRLDPCDTEYLIHVIGERRSPSLDGDRYVAFTGGLVGLREARQIRYRNGGTSEVRIDRIEPPQPPFTIDSTIPPIPCDLAPGDTLIVFVEGEYRPEVRTDSLRIVASEPCPFVGPTILDIRTGVKVAVRIPHLTGEIGHRIDVPVLLDTPFTITPGTAQRFTATVRWHASALRPIGTAFGEDAWSSNTEQNMLVTNITGTWRGGDTLAIIPSLILLSPHESIPLDLDDEKPFAWQDIPAAVEQRDGSLTIVGACANRIRRGTTFSGGIITGIAIHPLPMRDDLNVTIRASKVESVSFVLTDMTGRIVANGAGRTDDVVRVNTATLAAGLYVLQVMTPYERHDLQIMKLP